MKKIFKIILLALLFASCKNLEKPHDGYLITGTIEGIDRGIVTFDQDTITIANGNFTMKGKVDGVVQKNLRINDEYDFVLFLHNATFDVRINIDKANNDEFIDDVDFVGSSVNEEYQKVSNYLKNTKESKELRELFDYAITLKKGTEEHTKYDEALSDARKAARKVQVNYIKEYALNNPNSVIAAYYMRFQANEVDQTFEVYKQIVENFSEDVKRTEFHKPLQRELETLQQMAIGEIAPDFTLKTNEGEDFTLSSLRNEKVVLIDFWASWCIPCRKSYPHLKKTYDKYKPKGFEIVGVTNDNDHDEWKKAIEDDGLQWIQVADEFPPRGSGPPYTARVFTSYAGAYLPSTYLLDEQGRILAKQLHGEDLDEKLAEIFGE